MWAQWNIDRPSTHLFNSSEYEGRGEGDREETKENREKRIRESLPFLSSPHSPSFLLYSSILSYPSLDMWWVVPLIIGAAFWAGADTISDAVITDHTNTREEGTHAEEEEEANGIFSLSYPPLPLLSW